MKKICCVGILVADVMANISSFPKLGELERVESVTVHNGGNAMTAAVNLKRLGVESYLVGKVGDDIFGKGLLAGVKNSEVCTDGVKVDRDNQTSVSIVLLQDGERSFLHAVGANGRFRLNDIDFSVINIISTVLGYVLMFMNPINVLIYENHGRLEKKTKIFAHLCYSGKLIIGIGCYFLPQPQKHKRHLVQGCKLTFL